MGLNCSRRRLTDEVELQSEDSTGCSYLRLKTEKDLRIVCISDTHGNHRTMQIPSGDVLVHAGDFTLHGSEEQAQDFNTWLAEQPHPVKLVVLGNHENNSGWNKQAASVLSNAVLLRQTAFEMKSSKTGKPVRFFGTDFFWPCPSGNPYFAEIPGDTDILIAHGPAKHCADGDKGCPSLLESVKRVKPYLVLSGHVHWARGAARLKPTGTVLVNAANCGSGKTERSIVHGPVVIDM